MLRGAGVAAALLGLSLGFEAPARRAGSLVQLTAFHAEGDGSGDFLLSGVWRLTRRPAADAAQQPRAIAGARPSWSDSAYVLDSPFRAAAPATQTTITVHLSSDGRFASPPDTDEALAVRGKWSCEGREVVLTRFGRASTVLETYEGTVTPRAAGADAAIIGHMAYGAHEPEYSGSFEMEMFMPQLHPLRARAPQIRAAPIFATAHLAGKWSLQIVTPDSASIVVVDLDANGSWQTIQGVALPREAGAASETEEPRLAGKWNIYDSEINLGSGIRGTGANLWLWLRRWAADGTVVSRGCNLSADNLYMGRIQGPRISDDDATAKSATSVRGKIALGWSFEPAFIGTFHMKRWLDDTIDIPPGDYDE
ncbi:hypothetical protein M885DRAFT_622440 [Pelagophyceae sp. CCMP2097]|nr:hypothetical protein M885DRAFT_622440 [Pelagophyceae sp. CCMP2097]